MLIPSIIGAILGTTVVTKLPINTSRSILSITLLFVAILLITRSLGMGPFAILKTATAPTGSKLIIGIVINFILGTLMTAAFPIMMESYAFLMPPAIIKFLKTSKYNIIFKYIN